MEYTDRYRIREVVYDDDSKEFFPEQLLRIKDMFKHEEIWSSVSEMHKRITGSGYKTIEQAQTQVDNHKDKKKPFGQNVVEEKIHKVD